MLVYLPLALVALACLPVALAPLDRRIDRLVTRSALLVFGAHVADRGRRRKQRRKLLQAVHVPETYRMYAAKTMLYTGLAAVVGSVLGVYLVGGVLAMLSIPPEVVRASLPTQFGFLVSAFGQPDLALGELFAVLLSGSTALGTATGGVTYWVRWGNLSYRANTRERQIDESMARTVAFFYALSRSGMAFPDIMRTLARNRSVYGESAEEVTVAVKSIDLAGLDMLSAIERIADRSPSEKFSEFADNLASVLQSGQNLPDYLDEQYERYQEDAESQQESFLELLATLAEVYVSVFVVAPLLFITIFVIMGLMGLGDTLPILRVLAYFAIPLANVGFIVYLDSITESLHATRDDRDANATATILSDIRRTDDSNSGRTGVTKPPGADGATTTRSDGGTLTEGFQTVSDAGDGESSHSPAAENFERLAAFERIRWLRVALSDPTRTLRERPVRLLHVTVPLAALWILLRAWPHAASGTLQVDVVDGFVVQAGLFVVGTFAVVQELHRRRVGAIEDAVPDFLDRLASVNEAGMSVVESLGRVARSDLGALNVEVERTWTDIRWGVDAETALYRFEDRIDTPTVTRVVTLIANAMHASGDIARVLRIAADEAQDAQRLKRKRKQEMLTYLVVIYLSFAVFLVIVAALNSILIPNLPTGAAAPDGVTSGPLSSIAGVNPDDYTLLFFHTALVQAVCSGLVAGQMGEGTVADGAKHATLLLTVAYAVFLLLP